MTVTLEIDEPTPSRNRTHGAHWSRNHQMRKRWAWLVRAAVSAARSRGVLLPVRPRHAVVRVIRHGARLLDPDNATAGCKWLLDSLVTEGLLIDDKPEHLTLPPVEQHIGKPYRTIVEIAPCQS